MTQYDKPKFNNIFLFKNRNAATNHKAPAFNVSIEFMDGTKWRGGLWRRTSQKGLEYFSGSLDPDTGDGGGARHSAQIVVDDSDDWVR